MKVLSKERQVERVERFIAQAEEQLTRYQRLVAEQGGHERASPDILKILASCEKNLEAFRRELSRLAEER